MSTDDLKQISDYERSRSRYFLKLGNAPEQEVTEEVFIRAERSAGFSPKPGCGPVATAGFSAGEVSGRVEYRDV